MGANKLQTQNLFNGRGIDSIARYNNVLNNEDIALLQIVPGFTIAGYFIQAFGPSGEIKPMTGNDKANISGIGKTCKLNFTFGGQSADIKAGDRLCVFIWS